MKNAMPLLSDISQPYRPAFSVWFFLSVLIFSFLIFSASSPLAWAQAFDLGKGEAIEILADNGIEWQQDAQAITARGNASATRGTTRLSGDTLSAWYRPRRTETLSTDVNSDSEIYRLEARGHVVISSPTQTATGALAIYDMDSGKLILTNDNGPVSFTTPGERIIAEKSLEYDVIKKTATATGGATVYQENNALSADTLVLFTEEINGKSEMTAIEALQNVVIKTPRETARGSEGVYDIRTGIATLTGNVVITRNKDTLTGAKALVNMKTGVSTLYGGKTPSERARVVIIPEKKRDQESEQGEKRPKRQEP